MVQYVLCELIGKSGCHGKLVLKACALSSAFIFHLICVKLIYIVEILNNDPFLIINSILKRLLLLYFLASITHSFLVGTS